MTSVTIGADTGLFHLPLDFPLRHGGSLVSPQLAFEISGPADGPLVVVLGGISAGRHVCGGPQDEAGAWWDDFAGPGKAIETNRYRVLGLDWLTLYLLGTTYIS